MRSIAPFALATALAACASTPPPPLSPDAPEERESVSGEVCTGNGTAVFLGKTATSEVGAEIRQTSGAAIFQWVPPDSAVTMDYRPDRVRVHYDRAMKIVRITCG